jgi:hypothetical protein
MRSKVYIIINQEIGRAVAQAVSRWLPTAAVRFRIRAACGVCGEQKRQWGRFSPSTSVSSVSHHSTTFSIIIITRGWHNKPIGGRNGTQLGSTPPLYQFYLLLIKESLNSIGHDLFSSNVASIKRSALKFVLTMLP